MSVQGASVVLPLLLSLFDVFVSDQPKAVIAQKTKIFHFGYSTAILGAVLNEDRTVKKLEFAALQIVRYFLK